MTDIEIVKNRQAEIAISHGYTKEDDKRFRKVIGSFTHMIILDSVSNDCRINLFCFIENNTDFDGYNTNFIDIDYEELSLLIDIFNKNYF